MSYRKTDLCPSVERYNCGFCKRKYQTTSKLEDHMKTNHPNVAKLCNSMRFTLEERLELLDLLEMYMAIIKDIPDITGVEDYTHWNGVDPSSKSVKFIWYSHMLLPEQYQIRTQVKQDAVLSTMVANHIVFCERASEFIDRAANHMDKLIDEFNLFLNLGFDWKGSNFCPSMLIDLVWHAAMMNPEFYIQLTNRFFGKILPHCLEDNESNHAERFAAFQKQFIFQHSRRNLSIDDLDHLPTTTLDEVRNLLLKQVVDREEFAILEQARREKIWKQMQEESRKDIEAYNKMVRDNPNKSFRAYGDDGRC